MKSRTRLIAPQFLLAACLLSFSSVCVYAEEKLIPDAPRIWTHRDGRSAELSFLRCVADTVLLADAKHQRIFRIALKDLSLADLRHLQEILHDGSRVWTRHDGTARRMKFVAVESDNVVFDVPNVGQRTVPLSDLISADQSTITLLASNQKAHTHSNRNAMRSRLVSTSSLAENQLTNQQILEAVNKAFENDDLKQGLSAIGSSAKFSAGEVAGSVNVTFGQTNLSSSDVSQQLIALAQKAKPQVIQILNLREADASLFDFTLSYVSTKIVPKPADVITDPAAPSQVTNITPSFSEVAVIDVCQQVVCCPSTEVSWSCTVDSSDSCFTVPCIDSCTSTCQPSDGHKRGLLRNRRSCSE